MSLIDFEPTHKMNPIPSMKVHIALTVQKKLKPFGYDVIFDDNTHIYYILKDFSYCGVFEFGVDYKNNKKDFLSFSLEINGLTFEENKTPFGKDVEGDYLVSFFNALESNLNTFSIA